jgi:prepilin-type N-terminal cleavage/methylation domain-containing protein
MAFFVMHVKTQLELLRQLRQRQGLAKGFTLVELMIVVAIVGILSAVVLPRFLGARDAAEAGSRIGQLVGQAKECSVFVASVGVGTNPNTSNCSTSGGNYSTSFNAVSGLNCLTSSSTSAATAATIAITNTGAMNCTFS